MKSFVIALFATACLAAEETKLEPITGMQGCKYMQRENNKVCYRTFMKTVDQFWKGVYCSDTKKVNLGRSYFPTGALDYDEDAKKRAAARKEISAKELVAMTECAAINDTADDDQFGEVSATNYDPFKECTKKLMASGSICNDDAFAKLKVKEAGGFKAALLEAHTLAGDSKQEDRTGEYYFKDPKYNRYTKEVEGPSTCLAEYNRVEAFDDLQGDAEHDCNIDPNCVAALPYQAKCIKKIKIHGEECVERHRTMKNAQSMVLGAAVMTLTTALLI